MADDGGEQAVGYKQPPKRTQFQPGKSGNPKGRRKDARNFKSDLLDELREQIPVRENGRERKISKQRAFIKALVAAAIRGDMRATNALVSFCTRTLGATEEKTDTSSPPEDIDIIEAYVARERKRHKKDHTELKSIKSKKRGTK